VDEPGVIRAYAERVARELAFDPALARRMRREVEDHLREAAACSGAAGLEAERRAVAGFGDARAIAAQFAVVSLAKRARRAGFVAVLTIAAVFAAMKVRVLWYGAVSATFKPGGLAEMVLAVDRFAFWFAVLVGVAAWLYIDSRGIPTGLTRKYRVQLRRFSRLCAAAAVALVASVVCDGMLTSLRLVATGWSVAFVVPALLMAVEVACAGLLVSNLRDMARGAAPMLEPPAG